MTTRAKDMGNMHTSSCQSWPTDPTANKVIDSRPQEALTANISPRCLLMGFIAKAWAARRQPLTRQEQGQEDTYMGREARIIHNVRALQR